MDDGCKWQRPGIYAADGGRARRAAGTHDHCTKNVGLSRRSYLSPLRTLEPPVKTLNHIKPKPTRHSNHYDCRRMVLCDMHVSSSSL